MTLELQFFEYLQKSSPADAWSAILDQAWRLCAAPLTSSPSEKEILKRDRAVSDIDDFLATSGWDLWQAYEKSVPLTSDRLVSWWRDCLGGKAILILDALSLRECPWLISQAEARGFTIHDTNPTVAELPADTTLFAKALGFTQRSDLSNNGSGSAHRLSDAHTESTDIPWRDCADLVGAEPFWFFWHHWPDRQIHNIYAKQGSGLLSLANEAEANLTGDDFWFFVERLATGRRVVITADHGYASSGNFPDANKEQTEYLREIFKGGRWNNVTDKPGACVPPLDLLLETRHGRHLFVNGRRKWKITGGYPTLTHGGLTILEVAVPWIEISKIN